MNNTQMNNTQQYVAELAVFLHSREMRMSARELAEHLNLNNLPTGYGTPYVPEGRGIYRLLSTLYSALAAQNRMPEAEAVAEAFTKEDGSYAYDAARAA
jgi:hypothetical protein